MEVAEQRDRRSKICAAGLLVMSQFRSKLAGTSRAPTATTRAPTKRGRGGGSGCRRCESAVQNACVRQRTRNRVSPFDRRTAWEPFAPPAPWPWGSRPRSYADLPPKLPILQSGPPPTTSPHLPRPFRHFPRFRTPATHRQQQLVLTMQALPVKARVAMLRGDEAKQREEPLHPARASPKPPPNLPPRPASPAKRAGSLTASRIDIEAHQVGRAGGVDCDGCGRLLEVAAPCAPHTNHFLAVACLPCRLPCPLQADVLTDLEVPEHQEGQQAAAEEAPQAG